MRKRQKTHRYLKGKTANWLAAAPLILPGPFFESGLNVMDLYSDLTMSQSCQLCIEISTVVGRDLTWATDVALRFLEHGKVTLALMDQSQNQNCRTRMALENQVLNIPPDQPNSEDTWTCSASIRGRIDNCQTEGSVPVNTPNSKVNSQIFLRISCLLLIRLLSHFGRLSTSNCQTMHNKPCFMDICTNLGTAGTTTHGPDITGPMQNVKVWRTEWICPEKEYIQWILLLPSVWNSLC